MSEPKTSILRPVNFFAFLSNFLVLIFSTFLVFLHWGDFPPQIPLWFSEEWGIDRLAKPEFLLLLPVLILVILLVNNLFAKILEKNHKPLSLILVWTSLFISLIIFFPIYRIILAVS